MQTIRLLPSEQGILFALPSLRLHIFLRLASSSVLCRAGLKSLL